MDAELHISDSKKVRSSYEEAEAYRASQFGSMEDKPVVLEDTTVAEVQLLAGIRKATAEECAAVRELERKKYKGYQVTKLNFDEEMAGLGIDPTTVKKMAASSPNLKLASEVQEALKRLMQTPDLSLKPGQAALAAAEAVDSWTVRVRAAELKLLDVELNSDAIVDVVAELTSLRASLEASVKSYNEYLVAAAKAAVEQRALVSNKAKNKDNSKKIKQLSGEYEEAVTAMELLKDVLDSYAESLSGSPIPYEVETSLQDRVLVAAANVHERLNRMTIYLKK